MNKTQKHKKDYNFFLIENITQKNLSRQTTGKKH